VTILRRTRQQIDLPLASVPVSMGKKVIVVAGTSSGVGKTSMTVGILRALRNRGLKVQAFKVGPGKLLSSNHIMWSTRNALID
jgi:uncharacterized NAD-dependent epimerase/dehydratase family protein